MCCSQCIGGKRGGAEFGGGKTNMEIRGWGGGGDTVRGRKKTAKTLD